MSFLAKIFGQKPEAKKRIRICVECGMPIEQHKDWCAILKGQKAMAAAAAANGGGPEGAPSGS
jgi:hypothetical protein